MNDHVGTVVAGRYELTRVLGRGGHGVVYEATDRTTGQGVAVKMLSDSYANAPEYAARLAREQEALVALAGTSAVAVYDLCQAPNGAVCLVMELLEGTDLETVLAEYEAKGERMPLPRVSAIIDPVVDTLERAHDAKILHRDVKPGNIFLLSSGEGVRLFDFGLSRKMASARLTVIGTVMGSPSYIAPEVWKGRSDELDTRVDVYSLGVILYRMLTGKLPFEGATLLESLTLATTAPRPSLRAERPDLPPAVDRWTRKALAVERDERFETVTALWLSLLDALRVQPPARSRRPVTDSLVNAWKAAATAFKRFVPAAFAVPEGKRPSLPPPSIAPDTAKIDSAWEELTDDDVVRVAPPPLPNVSKIDDAWEEVSSEELDRPSLFASPESERHREAAPPSARHQAVDAPPRKEHDAPPPPSPAAAAKPARSKPKRAGEPGKSATARETAPKKTTPKKQSATGKPKKAAAKKAKKTASGTSPKRSKRKR